MKVTTKPIASSSDFSVAAFYVLVFLNLYLHNLQTHARSETCREKLEDAQPAYNCYRYLKSGAT